MRLLLLLPLITALVLPMTAPAAANEDASLAPLLEQTRSDAYRAPTAAEADAWRAAFRALLGAGETAPLEVLGMTVAATSGAVIVREGAERSGRGLHALRIGATEPLLVQAPHQFADLHTGAILAALFDAGLVPAAAFNTVHRYSDVGDKADLTHAGTSVLRAASLAFADVHPGARIVQLHGYATEKREGAARASDAILSAGIPGSGDDVPAVAACLAEALGLTVLVYGRDTTELGATRNVVGQAVRPAGARFIHIEMNLPLRERLRADAGARAAFAACLRAGRD